MWNDPYKIWCCLIDFFHIFSNPTSRRIIIDCRWRVKRIAIVDDVLKGMVGDPQHHQEGCRSTESGLHRKGLSIVRKFGYQFVFSFKFPGGYPLPFWENSNTLGNLAWAMFRIPRNIISPSIVPTSVSATVPSGLCDRWKLRPLTVKHGNTMKHMSLVNLWLAF